MHDYDEANLVKLVVSSLLDTKPRASYMYSAFFFFFYNLIDIRVNQLVFIANCKSLYRLKGFLLLRCTINLKSQPGNSIKLQ